MTAESAPFVWRTRTHLGISERVKVYATREICPCGREFWRWPWDKTVICAHCLSDAKGWGVQRPPAP